MSDYLTLKEFVSRHPVSESTVRRWIKSGRLAHVQPGGPNTTVWIPADAVDRLQATAERSDPETGDVTQSSSACLSGPKPRWQRS